MNQHWLLEDKDTSVEDEKAFRKSLRSSKPSTKKRLFEARSKKAIQLGKGRNLRTKRMQGNSLGPNTENIVFFPRNDQPVCQDITAGKNSEFSIFFLNAVNDSFILKLLLSYKTFS